MGDEIFPTKEFNVVFTWQSIKMEYEKYPKLPFLQSVTLAKLTLYPNTAMIILKGNTSNSLLHKVSLIRVNAFW